MEIKHIHKGHTIYALMLMIGAVFCGTPYPKVFDGSNGNIGYYALDYHATAGIVLGGYCNDTSICGSNNPNPIIELFNPTTLDYIWSIYLTSATKD